MRHVGLIVNPRAGRGMANSGGIDALVRVLAEHEVAAEVHWTSAEPGSARDLAVQAAQTCEMVLACGGDGTVHGALQGVAGTETVFGVLPFGTANALARNLRLPVNPVGALKKILGYKSQRIPLGYAETAHGGRWFTVMAGAGPDGRLVHEMSLAAKARMGRGAYYAEAGRLFLTRRFPGFRVEYRRVGSTAWESRTAVALIAARVPNLGGLFRGLTAGSQLDHPHLVVQVLAAPGQVALPAWIALGQCGLGRMNPLLTTLAVDAMRCIPVDGSEGVYAQVDGEAFGMLPMAVRVEPGALRLLKPS